MVGRLRHEAGQTVVLFAVLLPLLLGLGAIAVDIGYWYVVGKKAQDAADAAALAAARELPDKDAAGATAMTYVQVNMPDASWDVEFPYIPNSADSGYGFIDGGKPDYTKVEVTVTHATGTFFGGLFGLVAPTVSRRAVAERLDSPGNLAIHSHGDDCSDGLEFDAENVSIFGLIHSNGQFRISRGPFWAADGTFYAERCRASVDEGAVSQFGDDPSATLPRGAGKQPWPTWLTPAQVGWFTHCQYKGATIEITTQQVVITQPDQVIDHGGLIPSGTYCATKSFTVTGDGLRGRLTALAPNITVGGNNNTFSPHSGAKVLFFAVPNSDFNPENDGSLASGGEPDCQPSPAADLWLDGSGHNWRGLIFSPCGRVVVNVGGGRTALDGTIVAHQVQVEADGFNMIGRSDFESHVGLAE